MFSPTESLCMFRSGFTRFDITWAIESPAWPTWPFQWEAIQVWCLLAEGWRVPRGEYWHCSGWPKTLYILHIAKATSVWDLRERVAARCPNGTPIPSDEQIYASSLHPLAKFSEVYRHVFIVLLQLFSRVTVISGLETSHRFPMPRSLKLYLSWPPKAIWGRSGLAWCQWWSC